MGKLRNLLGALGIAGSVILNSYAFAQEQLPETINESSVLTDNGKPVSLQFRAGSGTISYIGDVKDGLKDVSRRALEDFSLASDREDSFLIYPQGERVLALDVGVSNSKSFSNIEIPAQFLKSRKISDCILAHNHPDHLEEFVQPYVRHLRALASALKKKKDFPYGENPEKNIPPVFDRLKRNARYLGTPGTEDVDVLLNFSAFSSNKLESRLKPCLMVCNINSGESQGTYTIHQESNTSVNRDTLQGYESLLDRLYKGEITHTDFLGSLSSIGLRAEFYPSEEKKEFPEKEIRKQLEEAVSN